MIAEAVLFALLLGTTLLLLATRLHDPRLRARVLPLMLALSVASGWAAVRYRDQPISEQETRGRPIEVPSDGYVSSGKCRACHAREYNAWHGSYHRTMTQVATPASVLGDFDDVELRLFGRDYRLERRGDQFWVEMDRLPAGQVGLAPRVEKRIALVTGSHHMQVYWFGMGDDRMLGQLPFVHLVPENRWVPRSSAFLMPPRGEAGWERGRWNTTCVKCHTTHGRPRVGELAPDADPVLDTHVGEFGIACEACHGPADEHVALNQDPQRRYRLHWSDAGDPSIVNPEKLPDRRASEVCGQCHSVFVFHDRSEMHDYFARGFAYRPGDELASSRKISHHGETTFWLDGMTRVAGREYNGLIASPCYQGGELGCLSCHSLHKEKDDPRTIAVWADDQLKPGMRGNEACLGCHDRFRDKLTEHTHHKPDSTGSRCYNCHMPYTTYGLLKAIRSHTIDSPSVATTIRSGRPNACNQCHLDQTLAWTADQLEAWYEIPEPELFDEERAVAASVLWTLRGDAGQRVLMAWSMGWDAAIEASGSDWMVPYLNQLLDDPYDVVRFIAHRSLRSHRPFEGLEFDFVAPAGERAKTRSRVLAEWNGRAGSNERRAGAALLIGDDGLIQPERFAALLAVRDDRPIYLAE